MTSSFDSTDIRQVRDSEPKKTGEKSRNNAATGASAAGARALSAQMIAFYFRAPIKAFFRTRVE
jgi:hypothetical protein